MAKKKKKKASSIIAAHQPQQQQASSTTPSSKVQQHQVGESSVPEAEGFLSLKLKRTTAVNSKSAGGSSVKNELPTLLVAEQDAGKIGARRNDDVLVFVKNQDKPESLAGVLICRVDVVASPSVRSPSSATKRQTPLPFGTCQVHPSHHVEGLFPSAPKNVSNNDTDTNSVVSDNATQGSSSVVLQTPSPSKPQQTPSKSGFSFAVGGGGDSLISPLPATPSSYSTPKVKQKPQGNRTNSSIWITPISSPVGQDAQSILCQDASDIHITIPEDASTALTPSRLSSYKCILEQLFLANCSGRYVHSTDAITISFQGKPLALEMHVVESEGADAARKQQLLELEMETLEIQDDYPDGEDDEGDIESQLWKLLRKQLEAPTSEATQKLLLHKITRETRLTFSCQDGNVCDDKSSSYTTESVKESDSSPVSKLVAGLTPTLTRLRSLLLAPLLKPELFSGGSLKAPRGVLLHGSPGVGKSSLANQLALDLAREYPVRFRVEPVNCATLQSYSSQVGEAEKILCSIFERAALPASATTNTDKAAVGTLLIFDDIQLICKKRSGYNAGSDRLAATLLGLLDGIGSSSSSAGEQAAAKGAISNSIVILAITSDPSVLDPALRRPGRLDFELEVPAPDDPATRAAIIDFHLKDLGNDYNIPQFSDKDLLSLGKLAKGFNGADCMLSVKEALRIAIFKQQLEGEAITVKTGQHELTLTELKTAIRATKPSAIKSVTVEIPTVLWSSIGGMESVKRELREAIELPMTHAHFFDQLGIPPPRGILLYGPPGKRSYSATGCVLYFLEFNVAYTSFQRDRLFKNLNGARPGNRREDEFSSCQRS